MIWWMLGWEDMEGENVFSQREGEDGLAGRAGRVAARVWQRQHKVEICSSKTRDIALHKCPWAQHPSSSWRVWCPCEPQFCWMSLSWVLPSYCSFHLDCVVPPGMYLFHLSGGTSRAVYSNVTSEKTGTTPHNFCVDCIYKIRLRAFGGRYSACIEGNGYWDALFVLVCWVIPLFVILLCWVTSCMQLNETHHFLATCTSKIGAGLAFWRCVWQRADSRLWQQAETFFVIFVLMIQPAEEPVYIEIFGLWEPTTHDILVDECIAERWWKKLIIHSLPDRWYTATQKKM